MTGWGEDSLVVPGRGVQAGEVLIAARTHLDDDDATLWSDNRLFPKLQEAHRELQLRLALAGVPVLQSISAILTVPANTTFLNELVGYPTNLIVPNSLYERSPGGSERDFVPVLQTTQIPLIAARERIHYWTWAGNQILILTSTSVREVQINYHGGLTIPQKVTDPIGVIKGETYLSYKTAAIALGSLKNTSPSQLMEKEASANRCLEMLLGIVTLDAQKFPVRRKSYRR